MNVKPIVHHVNMLTNCICYLILNRIFESTFGNRNPGFLYELGPAARGERRCQPGPWHYVRRQVSLPVEVRPFEPPDHKVVGLKRELWPFQIGRDRQNNDRIKRQINT
jgi:hypothetical protein